MSRGSCGFVVVIQKYCTFSNRKCPQLLNTGVGVTAVVLIHPSVVSLGNFISTAEKIRLPDDCTIGYIIEVLLEVPLTHTHLFHSHLENLRKLPTGTVLQQVVAFFTGVCRSNS